jgi:hypothetical protein
MLFYFTNMNRKKHDIGNMLLFSNIIYKFGEISVKDKEV